MGDRDRSTTPTTAVNQSAGPTPRIPKAGFKEETGFPAVGGRVGPELQPGHLCFSAGCKGPEKLEHCSGKAGPKALPPFG